MTCLCDWPTTDYQARTLKGQLLVCRHNSLLNEAHKARQASVRPWPRDEQDRHQLLACSTQANASLVPRPCRGLTAVVQKQLHSCMLCKWCQLLQGTFSAGALHSWLLHQVAPRVAAPCTGAGSSIVRNDGHLRHRCLAFSGADRLCRRYLQNWGFFWVCLLGVPKLCQPPLPLLPPTTPAEGQSAAGRKTLHLQTPKSNWCRSHGSEPMPSNRKRPKASSAASEKPAVLAAERRCMPAGKE